MVAFVYQSGSAIEKVQVRTNEKGGLRAYIHAAENSDINQLAQAKENFATHGWKFVPTIQDGKPVLEVRGFKKPSELTQVLASNQLIHGVEKVEREAGDVITPKQKLNRATMFLAGLSYNIGDIAFSSYSYGEYKDYKAESLKAVTATDKALMADNVNGAKFKIAAGVGYALGGIILSGFSHRDQSQNHIARASKQIQNFTQNAGIDSSKDSAVALATMKPKRSFIEKAYDTLGSFPSEALNIVYTGVGLLLMVAAIKHRNAPQKVYETIEKVAQRKADETWDIGLGVVTAASSLTSLLVKEQKFDEDHPKRKGIMGFVDWIREKPLRATGYGYMIATAFHAKGTWNKWKEGDAQVRKTVLGRAVFVATNVISEILLAISSKGHGAGVTTDNSVEDTVLSIAADTIVRQPKEKQQDLINQLAGHLSSTATISSKPEIIAQQLREHLKALESNPWVTGHRTVKAAPAQAAAVEAETAPEHDRPRATISAARELLPVIDPSKAATQQLAPAH